MTHRPSRPLPFALLSTFALCAPAAVQAQSEAPIAASAAAASCDGTWTYTHVDKARGWPADVQVTIAGATGTYVAHLGRHRAKNSPCRDRDFPVAVSRCTATELVFDVQGDRVADGCPTFTARLRFTGPDTAQAVIGHGEIVEARRVR